MAKQSAAKKQSDQKNLSYSKELLMGFYDKMLRIRRFEEKAGQLYGQGLIGGFCHLYIGQEAVVTGFQKAIIEGDQVITTYRDHGHMIACDTDPKIVFSELMGRADGCSRGKGGSMHMFDLENHFYGGHGIVGANVPIGTGIAFANKYRENNNVCLCYFGDGAANQGQAFESFNMAALWDLPVIYIIENNEYAMGTSTARSAASTEFFRRGEAFGIKGERVDGMNVLEVYDVAERVIKEVREEQKPYVLELKTYRYRGHSMSDPAKYRTKDEVKQYKEDNDPIINLQRVLINNNITTEKKKKKIDKQIKDEMAEAIEFSKNSPEPDESELYTDVLRGF